MTCLRGGIYIIYCLIHVLLVICDFFFFIWNRKKDVDELFHEIDEILLVRHYAQVKIQNKSTVTKKYQC